MGEDRVEHARAVGVAEKCVRRITAFDCPFIKQMFRTHCSTSREEHTKNLEWRILQEGRIYANYGAAAA